MRTSTHTNKGRPLTPEELTAWRERLGLKRQRLAELLGLGESRAAYNTVQRWEAGVHRIPPHLQLALERLEQKLTARTPTTNDEA
jgi:DNA-binding transcriptional regulator YiaG